MITQRHFIEVAKSAKRMPQVPDQTAATTVLQQKAVQIQKALAKEYLPNLLEN